LSILGNHKGLGVCGGGCASGLKQDEKWLIVVESQTSNHESYYIGQQPTR